MKENFFKFKLDTFFLIIISILLFLILLYLVMLFSYTAKENTTFGGISFREYSKKRMYIGFDPSLTIEIIDTTYSKEIKEVKEKVEEIGKKPKNVVIIRKEEKREKSSVNKQEQASDSLDIGQY